MLKLLLNLSHRRPKLTGRITVQRNAPNFFLYISTLDSKRRVEQSEIRSVANALAAVQVKGGQPVERKKHCTSE